MVYGKDPIHLQSQTLLFSIEMRYNLYHVSRSFAHEYLSFLLCPGLWTLLFKKWNRTGLFCGIRWCALNRGLYPPHDAGSEHEPGLFLAPPLDNHVNLSNFFSPSTPNFHFCKTRMILWTSRSLEELYAFSKAELSVNAMSPPILTITQWLLDAVRCYPGPIKVGVNGRYIIPYTSNVIAYCPSLLIHDFCPVIPTPWWHIQAHRSFLVASYQTLW